MGIEKLDFLRKLIIISLFSDDDLMDIFVLKGGNALNIIFEISSRASKDIDISMPIDFEQQILENIKVKLEKSLINTFKEHNFHVFDVTLIPQPIKKGLEEAKFWGGYKLKFKIIERDKLTYINNIESLRRSAISYDDKHTKNFTVDISKYEFCDAKEERDLDGYTIYVYTPIMVVFEKLRAICQQMEAYTEIVTSHRPRPRARDFFDIYSVLEHFNLKKDIFLPANLKILQSIFEIKKVPLSFLGNIESEREFHRNDFNAVKDTVTISSLNEYDFYFDYVLDFVDHLKSVWKI